MHNAVPLILTVLIGVGIIVIGSFYLLRRRHETEFKAL
jgi:LPXTG-motif cell wall-anchored protein